MTMESIIENATENIRKALHDYGKYTKRTEVLDNISDEFIDRLAADSAYAKRNLRQLFSKSPVWDEKLDALIINGSRTHDPDRNRICTLACTILCDVIREADDEKARDIQFALNLFTRETLEGEDLQEAVDAINRLAPKAYAPNKKMSRVFKALCSALGVVDETSGSEFQRLYAKLADELSARKINFKLYVSINPAHFLTMSNPKMDTRGTMMTSCHSLNSNDYTYNNGCSGYARDEVSFIVFTVADPSNPETLNNRKTSRQIFAYRPGSGLLLQSRMYNTSGGCEGAVKETKIYRELIQRELSMLEDMPNLWKTYPSYREKGLYVLTGEGFGGYPDWTYSNFDGHVSFRQDCSEDAEPLSVGTWGLCVKCGTETMDGIYCDDCNEKQPCCEHCEGILGVGEETYQVRDELGDIIYVCVWCRDNYYEQCYECGEYHPNDSMTYTGNGNYVCENCIDDYAECDECGELHYRNHILLVTHSDWHESYLCEECIDDEIFTICPHCGMWVEMCSDNSCPACGAMIEGGIA